MTLPGYGDPETWTAYGGHPLDPRAPIDYAYCGDCGKETTDVEFYVETEMCRPCYNKMLDEEEKEAIENEIRQNADAHLEMNYEDRYEGI